MKIKLYILTYKNSKILNEWLLKSLYESNFDQDNVEVNIINNHSDFEIYPEYQDKKINVLHNVLRPDRSLAYVAKNWNEAIVNGFQSLKKPDCDAVITIQNDTILLPTWYEHTIKLLKKYNLIIFGAGDQFIVHTPESVKRIGLWDERFCGVNYHEADYLTRAFILNKDKTTCNDTIHSRDWNLEDNKILLDTRDRVSGNQTVNGNPERLQFYTLYNHCFYELKWKCMPYGVEHKIQRVHLDKPKFPSMFHYIWFEKDVETLKQQTYLLNEVMDTDFSPHWIDD